LSEIAHVGDQGTIQKGTATFYWTNKTMGMVKSASYILVKWECSENSIAR
jgi:hypothetical protein